MVNAIHKLGFLESFMKENFMFYCLLKPEMMIYGTTVIAKTIYNFLTTDIMF